jgi:hypothetical protein
VLDGTWAALLRIVARSGKPRERAIMNARSIAQLVGTVGIVGMLVTGCAVQTDGEKTGESSEAVKLGSGLWTGFPVVCPDAGPLSASYPIEAALIDLGCTGDRYATANTGTNTAKYQVLCPANATYTYTYTEIVNTKPVRITYTFTLGQFLAANAAPPESAEESTETFCPGGTFVAPSGYVIVDYDPLCNGSACGAVLPKPPTG